MRIRITLRLEESLLEQAKAEAVRRKTTLTSLIEEGLHRVIRDAYQPIQRKKAALPISKMTGGTLPGVDISNSAELLDIMEGYPDPARR